MNLNKLLENTYNRIFNLSARRNTANSKVMVDLHKINPQLFRRELDDWKMARLKRYDVNYPLTYLLQDIYTDAMLDVHLAANIENRVLRIVNKQFTVVDSNDKPDYKKTALLQTDWFTQIVRAAIESIFYGYSLVFVKEFDNGNITEIQTIDRRHVIPEKHLIVQRPTDNAGLDYRLFPSRFLYISLGQNPIGLLEKITPLTILKRHSWAAWDEFEQLFGIPIRIARTADPTPKHREELNRWLGEMGSSAFAVLPKAVDIEIKENNRSDAYEVFEKKIELINKEISKIINGQTMTMDDGSSRSQSQTHLATQNQITTADITAVESWINKAVLPMLMQLGFGFKVGDRVDIVEQNAIEPADKIKIDAELIKNGYVLNKDYLENTYDVVIEQMPSNNASAKNNNSNLSFFD